MAEDLSKLRIDKTRPPAGRPARTRKRLYWTSAVVLVLLFALAYWMFFARAIPVQVTTVAQVYPSQTFTLLNASGYVVAQRKSALASKVTGRLVWLGVEEGSRVKPGEVIARLESRDVAAARDQAAANFNTARWNLDQAKAELYDATRAIQRARELVAKGYIAQAEYDSSLARYEKAEAAVRAARASVKSNEAALKGAEVSVEYTLIRAPFSAVVLTKNADVGDIVTPIGAAANAKSAVVTIADMDSLQVEADVSESSLSQVKVGQPCEIQLDALPDSRFSGQIHTIVPTADRAKATVMVKVRFLDKDPRILPEMSAKVAFLSRMPTAAEQRPRTAVNASAVTTRNGRTVLFLVKQGVAEETAVTTGERLGDTIEIKDGAKAGDQVVLRPSGNLRNGSRIRIAEQ